tara:strand:+ start:2286 stop:2666 length:381 start_codon:yes stop_codon:yes gene_type:complete
MVRPQQDGRKTGGEMASIYKIVSASEWRAAEAAGVFSGSGIDLKDGYIHFSTAAQAQETAAKHFVGASDLLLVEVDAGALDIKWEASRGGALFPHLYEPLPMSAVRRVVDLPLCASGEHRFPDMAE